MTLRQRAHLVAVLLVTVLVSVVAGAAPASAEDAKSIQVVDQSGRALTFLVYLDPNVTSDPNASLTSSVIISGAEVPSSAKAVVQQSTENEAILVLDVSGSMRGTRLTAAKNAAIEYVNGLPKDVKIGVVSFNDNVTDAVQPTTDKAAVIAAINGLEAGRKTALYDGIVAGLDMADPDRTARLVVLSDGGDTVSSATVDDVKALAAQKGTAIDIVALSPSTEHAALLQGIAVPSGGQFLLAADAADLTQAFEEATGSFGGKVTVTADVPENVDASGKFAIVTVGVDGTDFKGTAQLPKSDELTGTGVPPVTFPEAGSGAAAESATPAASVSWQTWLYAVMAALITIIGALAIASYRRQQRSRLRVEQVLWYSTAISTGEIGKRPELNEGGLLGGLDEWMSGQGWYPKVDNRLDNAGVRMSVATWMAVRLVAALVATLLVGVLLDNFLFGLIAGVLLGWLGSGMWLSSKENGRRKEFEEDLPDFLMLMASSLRAGLSVQQALDSSASEGKGEVSRQIRRAMSEVQMGSTIEAALLRVADRMQNDDLRWTVTALAIQREVGGNLSNILDTAAATVKGRFELRREVRTLSAEGRLSGWVLAALPLGLFLYMMVANREYVSFFWTTSIGMISLAFIFVLFIAGFIWIRRIAKIEV